MQKIKAVLQKVGTYSAKKHLKRSVEEERRFKTFKQDSRCFSWREECVILTIPRYYEIHTETINTFV